MFTWICPKCGREVPPSYGDCPDCNPRLPKAAAPEPLIAEAPAAPIAPPPPPPPAAVVAPPPPPPPPPTTAPDPTLRVPFANAPPVDSRGGLPGWAIGAGFAVVLAGVLYVLFTYILPKKSVTASNAGAPTSESAAAVPGAASKKPHPLAKFLEIVGIRWVEDAKQKAKMQFIVVNHSAANLPELKMQITVKAGGKVLFGVPFTVPSIGPYESKEFSTPIQTALKGYELPDWQFVKADFEITSQP